MKYLQNIIFHKMLFCLISFLFVLISISVTHTESITMLHSGVLLEVESEIYLFHLVLQLTHWVMFMLQTLAIIEFRNLIVMVAS